MALTARLDLAAWRNDNVYEFPLRVRGADLTDAGLVMEVRLAPDTPGAPLISLGKVTNGNEQGLRVASVSTVDGIIETDLRIRINKTTLADLPYMGEQGQSAEFSYALLLSGITRLVGKFVVLAHTYGSDAAPTTRPAGLGLAADQLPSSRATLTISATETVVLAIDGLEKVAEFAIRAEDAADRAEEVFAASTAGFVVKAAASGGPNNVTLTFPAGIAAEHVADGSLIRFTLPAKTTGTVVLNSGLTGSLPLYDWNGPVQAGNSYETGETVFARRDGAVWLVVHRSAVVKRAMVPEVVKATAAGTPDAITATFDEELVVFGTASGPIVMLEAGPAFNTGPTTLNGYPVVGRANGPLAGGEIGGSNGYLLMWLGTTNAFRLLTYYPNSGGAEAVDPLAVFRQPLIDTPFGSNPASGAVVPIVTPITGRGSSVGTDDPTREGGVYEGPDPLDYLVTRLNELSPGNQYVADNVSHGGHVVTQAAAQLAESTADAPIIFDVFGMNDGKAASFNAQEEAGNLAIRHYYYVDCLALAAAGKTVILSTTPHRHIGREPASMGGIAQTWPVARAAPVSPADMFPPQSQSQVVKDWTGGGVRVIGDVRFGIVNNFIRDVARRVNKAYPGRVILFDAEWSWFRNGVEPRTTAPGTADYSGYDALFAAGEVYHPDGQGHRESYQRCIDEFVAAVRGGTGSKWWFRGDYAEVLA